MKRKQSIDHLGNQGNNGYFLFLSDKNSDSIQRRSDIIYYQDMNQDSLECSKNLDHDKDNQESIDNSLKLESKLEKVYEEDRPKSKASKRYICNQEEELNHPFEILNSKEKEESKLAHGKINFIKMYLDNTEEKNFKLAYEEMMLQNKLLKEKNEKLNSKLTTYRKIVHSKKARNFSKLVSEKIK